MFSKVSGVKIAKISCENDTLYLTQEKGFKCFINGSIILNSKDLKEIVPVTDLLIDSLCRRKNAAACVKMNPSYMDALNGILNTVSKSDQVKIQILKSKPDEIQENKPVLFKSGVLEDYRNNIKAFHSCISQTLENSDVFLNTQVPSTMWGSEEINKVRAKIKRASDRIDREELDIAAEQSDMKLSALGHIIERRQTQPKSFISGAVNHVVNDFLTFKKVMSSILMKFQDLYRLNAISKKATGYPITWIFDPTVYYNFIEGYEDMSDHLVEAARAHNNVIAPLYSWKIKIIGD